MAAKMSGCTRHTIDGRNGGAETAIREIPVEMERFLHRAGGKDFGHIMLVRGQACYRVSLP